MNLSQEEREFFCDLGLRLRAVRIARKETQSSLGARAGVSRQLIVRMEKGEPSVALGRWINVSSALGLLATWDKVLSLPVDPFAEYDKKQQELKNIQKKRVRT